MHNNFEDFNKLFFVDKVGVEAKFLNSSQDLEFLINLKFKIDVLKHFHYLMVVNGIVALLLLLKTERLQLLLS